MELDSFLASPRWDILQIITKYPASPTTIAEKLDTTVSYVSQQLKLLEAAGLVKKKRTGAVERGKPRMLFSIARELVYLIPLSSGLDEKKLLELDNNSLTILKIWALDNQKLHAPLQKIYWVLEPIISEITSIKLDTSSLVPKLYITVEEEPSTKLSSQVKKIDSEIKLEIIQNKLLEKVDTELTSIYDIQKDEKEQGNLKGGNLKK